mmetsp:Transcript_74264/g.103268  ORF Transcript_74264/g.103268 Transcript_74264/m.103268 type:complete len:214 (+) Transcript_74264:747-1388(+)
MGSLKVSGASLSIDQSGISHQVHAQTVRFQFLVHVHGTFRISLCRKAFNEVGDDDGVGRNHYPPLFEKRHCFFHLARAHNRIQHAAECHVRRDKASLMLVGHLVPNCPALLGLLQASIGLDEKSIILHRWFHGDPFELTKNVRQAPGVLEVNTGIQNGVQKHLVLAHVHLGVVKYGQSTLSFGSLWGLANNLQQDAHRKAVRGYIGILHVLIH